MIWEEFSYNKYDFLYNQDQVESKYDLTEFGVDIKTEQEEQERADS